MLINQLGIGVGIAIVPTIRLVVTMRGSETLCSQYYIPLISTEPVFHTFHSKYQDWYDSRDQNWCPFNNTLMCSPRLLFSKSSCIIPDVLKMLLPISLVSISDQLLLLCVFSEINKILDWMMCYVFYNLNLALV